MSNKKIYGGRRLDRKFLKRLKEKLKSLPKGECWVDMGCEVGMETVSVRIGFSRYWGKTICYPNDPAGPARAHGMFMSLLAANDKEEKKIYNVAEFFESSTWIMPGLIREIELLNLDLRRLKKKYES